MKKIITQKMIKEIKKHRAAGGTFSTYTGEHRSFYGSIAYGLKWYGRADQLKKCQELAIQYQLFGEVD